VTRLSRYTRFTERAVCGVAVLFGFIVLLLSELAIASEVSVEQRWQRAIANDQATKLSALLDSLEAEPAILKRVISIKSANGKDALMVAVKIGNGALAKRLVALGADTDAQTLTGGTPFMFAVLGDQLALAEWLHASGVDINAQGTNGWSAATIAAAKGHTDTLRWLLTAGVDYNAQDVYGFSPLMRAVDNQHVAATRVLLGATDIQVNAQDETGNTALHHAVAAQHIGLVKMLVDADASKHLLNREGQSAQALAKNQPAVARLLK